MNCLRKGSNVKRELQNHQRLCRGSWGTNGWTKRKTTGSVVAKELEEFLGGLLVKFREFKGRGLLLVHVSRLEEIEVNLQQVKEETKHLW